MAEWTFPIYTELRPAVKRFFEILDTTEYSERADKDFHPIRLDVDKDATAYISSIRVHKTAELNSLLPQMRSLANFSDEDLEQALITSG